MFDQIIVSFACDPRIKLIINFNLFFNPREHDSAITNILYYPMDPNDIHTVKRLAENDYSCNLYCPAFAKTGIYTGTLSSIYCFRPKLEYMDYDFRIEPSSKLDPSIEEMLSITPGIGETFKPKMNIRPLDNFQYYSFDMDYTFTLTDREHTADY
ncbi:MAG: hypothetical protein MJ233_00265 [Mycoplasmoidaceae bacterium]|nr:hypothetical protein [Mycoplasmoidaceae bacterium]